MLRRNLLKSAAAVAALGAPRVRAAEPKKIALWHIYARDFDMIYLGIKMFNEANNGYVIEPRLIPYVQINPELIRAIATDSPPDLVVINDPDIASYSSQGQFLDLTDRVAKSSRIGASSFYKGPATSDHWRGRRYAVAREMNALALYINDDMFRAKGLDPEKPPATWSQVMAAAEKLTDPARHVYGFGFCAHQSEQSTFQFLPWFVAGRRRHRSAGPAGSPGGAAILDRYGHPRVRVARRHQSAAVGGDEYIPGGQHRARRRRPVGTSAFCQGSGIQMARGTIAGEGRQEHPGLIARRFSFRHPEGGEGSRRRIHGHRADAGCLDLPTRLEHRRHPGAA
jgi:hypothetical protein